MDLTRPETHFAFGKNWASFAERIGEAEILEAQNGLRRLLGDSLDGLRMLDIGCGSGLHALAALRMGASKVVAIDVDADATAAARSVLERYVPSTSERRWEVRRQSVFDLPERKVSAYLSSDTYDIVYSWGIFHHTGDMRRAMRIASNQVARGGRIAFALYRRTWMDPFWKLEKRWYAKSRPPAQARCRTIYRGLYRLGLAATGKSFSSYVADYRSGRGMDFDHDAHDWLGGWPYESIDREEVDVLMKLLGYNLLRLETSGRPRFFGRDAGLLGSWCDEYVYSETRSLKEMPSNAAWRPAPGAQV